MEDALTTEEWMKLPLTQEDVDFVESFLEREGGIQSKWPWPTINKVLREARKSIHALEEARPIIQYLADDQCMYSSPGCGDCTYCDAVEWIRSYFPEQS